MDAHQRRRGREHVAHHQRDGSSATPFLASFETVDPEVTVLGRKVGFGDFPHFQTRVVCHDAGRSNLYLTNAGVDTRGPEDVGSTCDGRARRRQCRPNRTWIDCFILLLVKVAAAASIASILSRSGRFLGLLMRDTRSIAENLQLCLTLSGAVRDGFRWYGCTAHTRRPTSASRRRWCAALWAGMYRDWWAALICALPATLSGEYLAMPLYAAVGVLGGLLRDLAPDRTDGVELLAFFDLSLWRWCATKSTARAACTTWGCCWR